MTHCAANCFKELEDKHMKVENTLIEIGSDVLRVCIIAFGLGCFFKNHFTASSTVTCRASTALLLFTDLPTCHFNIQT